MLANSRRSRSRRSGLSAERSNSRPSRRPVAEAGAEAPLRGPSEVQGEEDLHKRFNGLGLGVLLNALAAASWMACQAGLALARAIFVPPRLVRSIDPDRPPQESWEFDQRDRAASAPRLDL